MEIWKTISEAPNYQISNLGNVFSLASKKHISKVINNKARPYYRVGLMVEKKRVFFLVHRIVAKEFIDNTYGLPIVNHIDENKQNNKVENLEWCTNKENIRHSCKNKIIQKSDGVVVKTWDSLYQIKDSGLFNISKVCECYNGKRSKHKNFTWHLSTQPQ